MASAVLIPRILMARPFLLPLDLHPLPPVCTVACRRHPALCSLGGQVAGRPPACARLAAPPTRAPHLLRDVRHHPQAPATVLLLHLRRGRQRHSCPFITRQQPSPAWRGSFRSAAAGGYRRQAAAGQCPAATPGDGEPGAGHAAAGAGPRGGGGGGGAAAGGRDAYRLHQDRCGSSSRTSCRLIAQGLMVVASTGHSAGRGA